MEESREKEPLLGKMRSCKLKSVEADSSSPPAQFHFEPCLIYLTLSQAVLKLSRCLSALFILYGFPNLLLTHVTLLL